jgi:signal transduction histidine kinase
LPNTVPPPVRIERVLLDGRPVDPADGIRISPGTRGIVVEYTALSFAHPNRVLFKYMLEGYDHDWVEAGTRRAAYYGQLPRGKYVFKVIACNGDGVWNEQGAKVAFVQQPHFYETGWFYGLIPFWVTGAAWGFARWSNHQLKSKLNRLEEKQAVEREKERERLRIARNLHDGLGANLTEIGLFAETVRRRAVSSELTKDMAFLSERVRGMTESLDAVVWMANPANDSLDRLSAYICETFEAVLRVSSIRGRQEVTGTIPSYPVTPEERSNLFLTAKEAINNLVKHSGATEAWLRIKMDGDKFCLSLEDNGIGFDPSSPDKSKRNGLANMRARVAELDGILVLNSTPGKGTSLSLSVSFAPLKTKNRPGNSVSRNRR